ncbi:GNAT family N-acetyltransferase [Actinacidiphila bryophytorum]|uniref:Acetyltransferase (GNAT) family protein n=1 Tax=Actinacidiphila bryophytorum TaxID=1436133 RepID=A0A9W4ECK4_9ACTN|nr:GNAT family N-acetyltransferase [Actinacidiphila bryophytorum]MBN6547319.1 GNAT family N-acetyltransferase [Actinacidiphila bryophytorum]CAG7603852.1 Acetyltransferase (GNAT) family protein [Actinacidiphila bryophytorum]
MPADFSAGARLEVRITPVDVGKRVSVRQLADVTDGRPTFTDTVGVLASWDEGVVQITRRTGESVRIAESALVAGKVVPPAPVRRGAAVPAVTDGELDAVAARAWPATETAPLGDWTLRYAGGFTRRANSVLAVGDPGLPLDEALAEVERWYGERGATPYLQLPDSSPYAAGAADRGWAREADTLVRTAPLAPLTLLPDAAEPVALSRTPDADWLAAYHRTGDLADAALAVVTGGPSVWFARTPGAIGRAVVDGPWALFGAVEVIPSHRRRGLALAVMGALARQAAREGATAAYLQVEADNDAARALYDRLGFTDHHGYHYRRPAA